jgi:kinesin family protein 1
MLQNALGGNSKTYMICAVRPGAKYFDETVNTLKYADRAKQIKNAAVVNENPQDKMIRELKEENEKLKAQLAAAGGPGEVVVKEDEESKKAMLLMQETLDAN